MQISKLFALILFVSLFTTSCLLSYNRKNLDDYLIGGIGNNAFTDTFSIWTFKKNSFLPMTILLIILN